MRFSRRDKYPDKRPRPPHKTRFREKERERGVRVALTLRQTCPWPKPRAQYAFKDSMIHVQRRSHYVSHFAAFFIVARAKISIVESCLGFEKGATNIKSTPHSLQHAVLRLYECFIEERKRVRDERILPRFTVWWVGCTVMILPQVHLRKPCYDFSFL